jgi:hypothetical protein
MEAALPPSSSAAATTTTSTIILLLLLLPQFFFFGALWHDFKVSSNRSTVYFDTEFSFVKVLPKSTN